ncbi:MULTISPECIES: tripartite tricarboxylate transporter TctB family protein [Prauserella salsuginis group]|uniref:Tripartite tricarboxylate transporter TctB family protein n=1 Tax=Prauserella salsuginis TaxID=387889 RepID=A0ABW6FWD3_9PSEU|nr:MULTISPECIES: tripartite tricarboxylate transporter TctB family protein [Prauserella salsuginis group]MCR3720291.1 putative tricarboxylic transport membrane protein [Prauserella flava]MCR3734001.1 putative tricarboxylic transport membrane protein [Prauserella salsuginis]
MTTSTTQRPAARGRKPRGELIVAGTVAVIGVVVLTRTVTMDVPDNGAFLGPQFFPYVVAALLLVLSALLVLQHVRREPVDAGDTEPGDMDAGDTDDGDTEAGDGAAERRLGGPSESDAPPPIDWKPFGMVAATLVLHVVLLEPLGWLIAGAGLFFGVSYALGGRNVLRDIGVAFVMSAVAQLAFSAGLGMALPAGILGAVV